MHSYLNTMMKRFWQNHLLTILLVRGFYGIMVGFTLYTIFSIDNPLIDVLSKIFYHYYPYFVWIYLIILYPVSIVFVKLLLGITERFNLYLRGFTIYLALAVLTYSILATT